jgi:hypothetical protein
MRVRIRYFLFQKLYNSKVVTTFIYDAFVDQQIYFSREIFAAYKKIFSALDETSSLPNQYHLNKSKCLREVKQFFMFI